MVTCWRMAMVGVPMTSADLMPVGRITWFSSVTRLFLCSLGAALVQQAI
jgi:hypothetical protein